MILVYRALVHGVCELLHVGRESFNNEDGGREMNYLHATDLWFVSFVCALPEAWRMSVNWIKEYEQRIIINDVWSSYQPTSHK